MTEASVFVVAMQAVAGPENSVPDGRRYDLLVFARGHDQAEAEAVATRGTSLLGWVEPVIARTGEITDPTAVPEDLRGAMEQALRNGCHAVVYDES